MSPISGVDLVFLNCRNPYVALLHPFLCMNPVGGEVILQKFTLETIFGWLSGGRSCSRKDIELGFLSKFE